MSMLKRIPSKIINKLKTIKTPSIVVGSVKNLTKKDILETKLHYMNFCIKGDKLTIDQNILIPAEEFGTVSNENVNGKEIIHKDKPKIRKNICYGSRPKFGDSSKGFFTLWQTKEIYQKSFIQPKGLSIKIEIQDYDKTQESWRVLFIIDTPFAINSITFEDDLLFALSLLNETLNEFDIFPSNITSEEIALTRLVNWEIFPSEKRDIKFLINQKLLTLNSNKNKKILERVDYIKELKPKQFIFGEGLNDYYYGALFHDNLIVFENIKYGNATYILYEDWEKLSKLSKTEILNSDNNFDRVIHSNNWKQMLKDILRKRLQELRKTRY
ncbi:hypothetical protein JXR93_06725 [bacterium]|nr:hypothetical protein [bacterium]